MVRLSARHTPPAGTGTGTGARGLPPAPNAAVGGVREPYRKSRARPDGALAPEDHFAGQGEWADPEGVLMAVEVTSRDRDRRERRDGYAAADIPVYLLVDRDTCTLTVCSEPEAGSYRSRVSRDFGAVVELPAPVGVTLETEKLRNYVQ
ncbi:Uma2 family endonuclease [Streptomyces sp. HNM0574]|uniref:Uma2 family endonuclease n=1 Tax=Streptomyces sp. HNM0574 TaxID=2714954 RepID=UPI00321734C6